MHSQTTQNNRTTWLKDIIFLCLVLSGIFFIVLGDRQLLVPDEARYSEIAREMVVSHDYVTPHLDGVKYFEKPILLYWLTSAAINIGGLNLWSVRVVNALLGLLGCILSYAVARQLYGRLTGLLAGFILGTSALYFCMLQMVNHDLTVTVFLSASLYAFIVGMQQPMGTQRRFYMWTAFAAAALAVLAKGLIGIVFPSIIVGAWLFIINDWRLLKKMYLLSSLLIFLLIAVPWHILVQIRNPEFFYYYFISQHFMRYTTLMAHHYEPIWYFIPILMLGFFPWVVFLPQAIIASLPATWQKRRDYKNELFFILWALLIFLFFSFSKSKLISYILPVMPPLAILTARYLAQSVKLSSQVGLKIGFGFLLAAALISAPIFSLITYFYQVPDAYHARIYLDLAALILLVGSIIAMILQRRHKSLQAITAVIISAGMLLVAMQMAIPYLDGRTILPLIRIIKPVLKPTDEVVAYQKYYQDLPFYLERRVTVVYHLDELDYGMQHQDTHAWIIDENTFWQRWQGSKRLFAVMNLGDYRVLLRAHPDRKLYVLAKTLHDVLVANQP